MLFLIAVLAFAATFTAVSLAVAIAWTLLTRGRSEVERQEEEAIAAFSSSLLKDESLSTISLWDALLTRLDIVEKLQKTVADAGLSWSVGRVTALMLLLGAAVLAAALNLDWIPTWAAVLLALIASLSPYAYLRRKCSRRLAKFAEQFPEALDGLCNALRAGHPFVTGVQLLSQEYPAPLGLEMRRLFEERKLGLPLDQALENLAQRVPITEVSLFVAAVQLQSRTGGNLGEVLGRLSESMRETAALQGEIRAIASHGKLTGLILTALPVVVVVVMTAVNPPYFLALVHHPYGKDLIAGAISCLALAHLIIQKIVDIPV